MTTLGEPQPAIWLPARWLRAVAALSTAGTRAVFLVPAWWILLSPVPSYWAWWVALAQLAAYAVANPAGVWLVTRAGAPWTSIGADLASVGLVVTCAVTGEAPLALLGAGAALAALRAVSDRSKDVLLGQPGPVATAAAGDPSGGLGPVEPVTVATRSASGARMLSVLAAGALCGAAAVLLGETGAFWLLAVGFAGSAAVVASRAPITPVATPAGRQLVWPSLLARRSRFSMPAWPSRRTRVSPVAPGWAWSSRESTVELPVVPAPADEYYAENQYYPDDQYADDEQYGDDAYAGAGELAVDADVVDETDPDRHDDAGAIVSGAGTLAHPWRAAAAGVWHDHVLRRLAALALLTNLLVQAGAVLAISVWQRSLPDPPVSPGFLGAVFLVGAAGVSLVLNAFAVTAGRFALAALGFLAGGTAVLLARGLDPALLVLVGAAFFAGAALSSVVPVTHIIVSQRVEDQLRSRVGAVVCVACLLSVPFGTAFAVWAGARELASAVAIAAACYLVGMLVPVVANRDARGTSRSRPLAQTAARAVVEPDSVAPAALPPAAYSPITRTPVTAVPVTAAPVTAVPVTAVPANVRRATSVPVARTPVTSELHSAERVDITLSYSDGQWLVEVHRGQTVLAARQPVPAAQAMRILSLLDMPDVQDGVEQALNHDREQAHRQIERVRGELAELEARLAGVLDVSVPLEITGHAELPCQR